MNKFYVIILLLKVISMNAQKDSLNLGDKYLEDQLYLDITYNVLKKKLKEVKSSSFSYGACVGYIRDIPIVKSGKMALGIGIGYGYDSFAHGLKVVENNSGFTLEVSNSADNKLLTHNLEMPLQFRLRSSNSRIYSFWRIYSGVKLSYNLRNQFIDAQSNEIIPITDVSNFNKFQLGLTMSSGYGTFNFHIYYGLTSILKSELIGQNLIDTKVFKIGVSLYIL